MSLCMPIINGTRKPMRHVGRNGAPIGRHWFTKGGLHRRAGPAVELASGDKEWWLKGYFQLAEQGDLPSGICDGSKGFPGYHMGEWRYSRLTRRSQRP